MSEGFAEGVVAANGNRNDGWGEGAWIWVILLFALCGGWGGNGAWGNNGGGQMMYDLGRTATTNDVASGFNNSAVLSNLSDLKLGQAGLQQTMCQGFSGIQHEISSCCCQTQRSIDQVRFDMAQNTCDIKQVINASTQRMLDYWCQRDMSELRNERDVYRNQLSQNAQTQTILNAINKPPVPSYQVPNPYTGQYGNSGNCNCFGYNNCCG